jgi:dolichol-phosphate mannosyltransferase
VVDDASPDGTADLAESVARRSGRISVLRRPREAAGLGAAYRAGFRRGLDEGYDVLVEMDADLSHDPAVVPSLVDAVTSGGADLAIGSRYVEGGAIPEWNAWRRALSRGGNRYADVALGLAVRDATAGFRAYRAETLRAIDIDHIRANGYAFQIETAYRAVRAGKRVVELPISFSERTEGQSKMRGRIIVEALALVSGWALRDALRGRRRPGT